MRAIILKTKLDSTLAFYSTTEFLLFLNYIFCDNYATMPLCHLVWIKDILSSARNQTKGGLETNYYRTATKKSSSIFFKEGQSWQTEFNGLYLDLKNMTLSQLKQYHLRLFPWYVIDNRHLITLFFLYWQQMLLTSEGNFFPKKKIVD